MSDSKLKGTLTLILGGVRSGKSRFGQELAHLLGGDRVLFVATAESRDDEMARRIDKHQQSRPKTWRTLEQPLRIGRAIDAFDSPQPVVLLDCLTLLVSNILFEIESDLSSPEGIVAIENRMLKEIDELIHVVESREQHLIIVSGEVGMGLVPETPLGRLFRDLLGWANQRIAERATSTYMLIAGLPINVTLLAGSVQQTALDLENKFSAGANP